MLHDSQGNAGIAPTSHLQSYLASRWLGLSPPLRQRGRFPVHPATQG